MRRFREALAGGKTNRLGGYSAFALAVFLTRPQAEHQIGAK
jgi:hypothetical protein